MITTIIIVVVVVLIIFSIIIIFIISVPFSVLYVNDLPDCIPSDTYLSADTKILRKIACDNDSSQRQDDLNKLQSWAP